MQSNAFLMSLVVSMQVIAAPTICFAKQPNNPALLQAVTFALTGGDNTSNIAFEPQSCEATITESKMIGRKTLTFHLNEISVDRIDIRRMANQLSQWVEVSLNGVNPVVDEADTFSRNDVDPSYEELLRKSGQNVESILAQEHSHFYSMHNYVLTLHTQEVDRLVRAWKYIYSHGCKGQRSLF